MSNDTQASPSVLRAGIAPGYALRAGLIAVMCLVFGLWGIYDYVITYPRLDAFYARAQTSRAFLAAAEELQDSGQRATTGTWDAFNAEILKDLEEELPASAGISLEATQSAVEALDPTASATLDELLTQKILPATHLAGRFGFGGWIISARTMTATASMRRGVSEDLWTQQLKLGILAARVELEKYGEVEEPAAYDRPMQWMFILCLPFSPVYAWLFFKHQRRRYQLDEDGTLHLPEGTWAEQDIADIDMSTWMKSSKAWVVHTDGTRVELDDYIYKPLWRIVGELAARIHPDAWTDQAKPVKTKDDDQDASDGESA